MNTVQTGAELLVSDALDLIRGRNLGIITNHTSVIRNRDGGFQHIIDVLYGSPGISIKALFSPEHGIRGDIPPGQHIEHGTDPKTGLPIYSLYGDLKKPTSDMLRGIDMLIYDIQDVGVRFYTFISTLYYTLEAAAESNIPYLLLDRPNMLSNCIVDGPLLEEGLRSFIGLKPIPVVYGLTPGELAGMIIEEGWLKNGMKVSLKTIGMKGYYRNMWYDDTGLPWLNPSPNLRSLDAVITYPGIALLEGTNISEGRGTETPFLVAGAPFVDGAELKRKLSMNEFDGVVLNETEFTPARSGQPRGGPKHSNKNCKGVSIHVVDRQKIQPVALGIKLICALRDLYPGKLRFRDTWFDRLIGTSSVRKMIIRGESQDDIIRGWQSQLGEYRKACERYFLYPIKKSFASV